MAAGSRRAARAAGVLAAPALLFWALHRPALDHDFVWIDEVEIEAGSVLRPRGQWWSAFAEPLQAGSDDFRLAGATQPYYRPLQLLVASAVADRFGAEPRAFRRVGFALGAATCSLLAGLAWLLLGRPGPALAAGAWVAAHPATLEVHVWVSGLSAALTSACLVLGALLGAGTLRARGPAARGALALGSLFALLLGLLSKESAAVLPGLTAALWLCERGHGPRDASRAGLALAVAQAAMTLAFMLGWRSRVVGSVGTGAPPLGGSFETQWLSSVASWPASLGWLLLPLRSNTSDAIDVVVSAADPRVWAGAALALGSAAAAVWLLRRGQRAAALGLAWVWIAFLPASGLLPLLHARSERNLFPPLLGAALFLAAWGAAALRRAPAAVAPLLALLGVAGLAERTLQRLPDWRSTRALFERDVAADPYHREGRFNLALALVEDGDWAGAKRHLDRLVEQRAELAQRSSYWPEALALEVWCIANLTRGAAADTVRAWERELGQSAAVTALPGLAGCLGESLEQLGRPARALPHYQRARAGSSGAGRQRATLGLARSQLRLGRRERAAHWLGQLPRGALAEPELTRERARLARRLRAGGL